MASVRERVSTGGETTFQVLYRHGGKQSSKTFVVKKKAHLFAGLVDDKGPDRALQLIADDLPDDRLTVAQLAEQWLAWKARPGEVTARTLTDYRRDVDNWIVPWFGHRAAEVVDEADVQRWVDHMAAKPLAPKSVADRHMLLNSMFNYGRARSRRLVTHNPCEETELPKPGKKRPKGTTVLEWRSILAAAHERNPAAEDLIRYLGTVGWRFSEATALPVRCVEVRRGGVVWVDMTQVFRMVDNRQVLCPETAKSFAGFRNVPVPSEETGTMLLRRIVGKGPEDFVFTNSRGGHWNQQTFLRETWPGILTDAGLWRGPGKSPTPHWLRHMAAAVLIAGGADVLELQRYLGHEDIKTTTGTYGGQMGGLPTLVLDQVNEILGGRGTSGHVVLGEVVGELSPAGSSDTAG